MWSETLGLKANLAQGAVHSVLYTVVSVQSHLQAKTL